MSKKTIKTPISDDDLFELSAQTRKNLMGLSGVKPGFTEGVFVGYLLRDEVSCVYTIKESKNGEHLYRKGCDGLLMTSVSDLSKLDVYCSGCGHKIKVENKIKDE